VTGCFAAREKGPTGSNSYSVLQDRLTLRVRYCHGCRKKDEVLKEQLELAIDRKHVEIEKILKDYGVPLLDRKANTK